MKKFLYTIAFVAGFLHPVFAFAQGIPEVLIDMGLYSFEYEETEGEGILRFEGEMDTGVAMLLVTLYESKRVDRLIMNSYGGYATEGYNIGRFLEDTDITVEIEEGTVCMSACAFAVMTVGNLEINGLIAFHSPYVDYVYTEDTLESVMARERSSAFMMTAYMLHRGYSIALIDAIIRRSSRDRFVVFTNSEDFYRMKVNNPLTLPDDYYSLYQLMGWERIQQELGN